MISSTRSSESASRSSWKDASSVISFSSTPSCSASISLTRSKTSSRDANRLSLLFSLSGRGARRCYTVGEAVGEPLPHSSGCAPDQDPAELASRRRSDLLAERVEDLRDRAFQELERDVARE